MVSVCFFFQAEDGIRDIGVTGVQTCALPISPAEAQEWWIETMQQVVETEQWQTYIDENYLTEDLRWGEDFQEYLTETQEIGRASCRGKSVDLGGRRIIKKKKTE